MHICKTTTIIEPDTSKAAFNSAGELEAYFGVTPFDELLVKEESDELATLVHEAQIEAIRKSVGVCLW